MKNFVIFFSLFLFSLQIRGQNIDSEINKLSPYVQSLRDFSRYIPQEKVYLHFDNTSYYRGDSIWFKCYLVTSGQNQLSQWSKTLYVELLNPGGEIVDKRILQIENGQCHGEFALNQLTFYSGFYEVRAYTKYMLSFGEDAIFSRLLPVFDKPKTEGNFKEKNMLSYSRYGPGNGNRPLKREPSIRENRVNLRFFPEGGNLVQGVSSRVAFEATDEAGNPIDVTVVITDGIDGARPVYTVHEGRGIFTYTPTGTTGRQRDIAEVEYSGRKYSFDLPAALPQGVVMEVDNLSHPDSIGITLRKSDNTPSEMFGVAVLTGGKLQNNFYVGINGGEEISYKIDKTRLPAGVSQIVLFNSRGEALCDRLVFTANNDGFIDITAQTGKQFYMPYEKVEMEFTVSQHRRDAARHVFTNPVQTTFSLSVRDGANMVEGNHNVLTDLLLMSEIKGYVRNPAWYFENDGTTDVETRRATFLQNMRAQSLDLLLMVQGWRRYSWNQMAGVETLDLKYLPEQGIEVSGNIVSLSIFGNKQTPKANEEIGLFLLQRGEEDEGNALLTSILVTDEQGRFSFVSDVEGKWNMVLSIGKNAKSADRIFLDRFFSPAPQRYRYADMQITLAGKIIENLIDKEETHEDIEDDYDTLFAAYQDSLLKSGIRIIPEITVRAKRTKAQEILENRSTSLAYYDMASELDDIYDRNEFVGEDMYELLRNMNENFSIVYDRYENDIISYLRLILSRHESFYAIFDTIFDSSLLLYKNKPILFIVDYQPIKWDRIEYLKYTNISIRNIKSIYINENPHVIAQYIVEPNSMQLAFGINSRDTGLGCVVLIETYPEGEMRTGSDRGIRRTWLEGYSPVKEFYSPNYSELPTAPDYRRTLYWNPAVTTDENGVVKINFYNNSSCRDFNISAETVTPWGGIGVYK